MSDPANSGEAIERARVIAWLMLMRRRIADRLHCAERAGAADAIVCILLEEIATGEHETLTLAILNDRPPVLH